ncbi:methionine adenosyltransferase domain-containing protein [Flavobacteriaceae bacterium]|nr:methionine adenosyltransferase domain-containing protein [Flavobacteriaceae bacterium]
MSIEKELKNRILVLDGAMGTMLQAYKFTEEDFRGERFKDYPTPLQGNNDLLSITQPEAIKTIHGKYFEAGADIIETNTFSGTTIAMADYQMQDLVYELNFQSAKIAKEVAAEFTVKEPHKPRFVAGSIGPTNRTASMSPDVNDPGFRAVTFNDLRIAYKQQVEALIDGGVDLLLVETVFDMRPYFIEKRLKLRTPIYSETAAYGHMGRTPEVKTVTFYNPMGESVSHEIETFTWEKLDYIETIKNKFTSEN